MKQNRLFPLDGKPVKKISSRQIFIMKKNIWTKVITRGKPYPNRVPKLFFCAWIVSTLCSYLYN